MSDIASIRLSELTHKINETLRSVFTQKTFWVIADITNYSHQQQKGYHYFDLVDKDPLTHALTAKVQTSAWGPGSAKIKAFEDITGQRFGNDIHVLVEVGVDYHPVFGLKLILLNIDPHFSLGLIEREKQATLKKLITDHPDFITKVGDEYITRNKQLSLSPVIQRIALVTSGSSAGMQDFIHTLESNQFHYRFNIDNYFTMVQGETNALAFYNKLIEVYQSGKKYDVTVIIRGGGAQTDFLLFDQLILGRIVAKFPIPVITGIGHQKDETIVDMMAHTSTKTPTRAAEHIIAHNRAFEELLMNEQRSIVIKVQQSIALKNQLLHQLNVLVLTRCRNKLTSHKDDLAHFTYITINNSRALLYKHSSYIMMFYNHVTALPIATVSNKRNELTNLTNQLQFFAKSFIARQVAEIRHLDAIARIMSPVNILKKGFAIVYQQNKIISDPDKLSLGGKIIIRLGDAHLHTTIQSKNKTDGDLFNV